MTFFHATVSFFVSGSARKEMLVGLGGGWWGGEARLRMSRGRLGDGRWAIGDEGRCREGRDGDLNGDDIARSEGIQRRRYRHTGMRSAYFCRMRSASAFRFSNGCSSLNLDRILVPLSGISVSESVGIIFLVCGIVCCSVG